MVDQKEEDEKIDQELKEISHLGDQCEKLAQDVNIIKANIKANNNVNKSECEVYVNKITENDLMDPIFRKD
ncbi:24455_t:CDS:2, partial [Racocetra persica]